MLYETLQIMRYLPLVQDVFHQQYHELVIEHQSKKKHISEIGSIHVFLF